MEDPRSLAAWLQRRALVLSKEHHDIHHASPYDTYYCVTVGFWNPLLDRTNSSSGSRNLSAALSPAWTPRLRVEREGSLNE